jgi:hypothetical protein
MSSGYLKPIGIKWTGHFGYLKHIRIKRTTSSGYLNIFGIEELPVPGNRKKTIGLRKPLVPIISKTSKNRRVSWKNWSFSGPLFDFFKSWEPGLYIKN